MKTLLNHPKRLLTVGAICYMLTFFIVFTTILSAISSGADFIPGILMAIALFCIGSLSFSAGIILYCLRSKTTNDATRAFAIIGATLLSIGALLVALCVISLLIFPISRSSNNDTAITCAVAAFISLIAAFLFFLMAWLAKAISNKAPSSQAGSQEQQETPPLASAHATRSTPINPTIATQPTQATIQEKITAKNDSTNTATNTPAKPPQYPRYLLIIGLLALLLTLPGALLTKNHFLSDEDRILHMAIFTFIFSTGLLLVMLSIITTHLHNIAQQKSIKANQIFTLLGSATIIVATGISYKALFGVINAIYTKQPESYILLFMATEHCINTIVYNALPTLALGCFILLVALFIKTISNSNTPHHSQSS